MAALATALAGCQSIGVLPTPGTGAATALPTDFIPVTADPFPPADGETDPNGELVVIDSLAEPDALGQPDLVVVPPADTDITIVLDDLRGSWTIIISGAACQLSMTSTPWETGYRGSTRDCPSDALAAVSSWDIVDQQVVLYSASVEAARFNAVSLVRNGDVVENARFEGQLIVGGTTLSFFR